MWEQKQDPKIYWQHRDKRRINLKRIINIHIFDYPDSRLSGLFTEVPTSPDNRGSTVFNNDPPVHVSSQVDLYADDYLNLKFH